MSSTDVSLLFFCARNNRGNLGVSLSLNSQGLGSGFEADGCDLLLYFPGNVRSIRAVRTWVPPNVTDILEFARYRHKGAPFVKNESRGRNWCKSRQPATRLPYALTVPATNSFGISWGLNRIRRLQRGMKVSRRKNQGATNPAASGLSFRIGPVPSVIVPYCTFAILSVATCRTQRAMRFSSGMTRR